MYAIHMNICSLEDESSNTIRTYTPEEQLKIDSNCITADVFPKGRIFYKSVCYETFEIGGLKEPEFSVNGSTKTTIQELFFGTTPTAEGIKRN